MIFENVRIGYCLTKQKLGPSITSEVLFLIAERSQKSRTIDFLQWVEKHEIGSSRINLSDDIPLLSFDAAKTNRLQ